MMEKPIKMDDLGVLYHYFRKHPFVECKSPSHGRFEKGSDLWEMNPPIWTAAPYFCELGDPLIT